MVAGDCSYLAAPGDPVCLWIRYNISKVIPRQLQPSQEAMNAERAKHQSMYDRRWRKARRLYLTLHPLCVYCQEDGYTRAASVVDHIRPHKGDDRLFWDESNWQPLCKTHHDATKQREESTGKDVGCDVNGNPLVKLAHW